MIQFGAAAIRQSLFFFEIYTPQYKTRFAHFLKQTAMTNFILFIACLLMLTMKGGKIQKRLNK